MLTHRLATEADLPALNALMTRAIEHLQDGFLSSEQVRASHKVMGLDTQLVADRTYFLVEEDGQLAGCGGWSFRATLYGGDHSTSQRNHALLDIAKDAARVRAMYTHPDFARRGVGRMILEAKERQSLAEVLVIASALSGQDVRDRPMEQAQAADAKPPTNGVHTNVNSTKNIAMKCAMPASRASIAQTSSSLPKRSAAPGPGRTRPR